MSPRVLIRLVQAFGAARWLFLAILATTCYAEGLQTWNELEYTVARSNRFELTVEGVHRFAKTVGELYDRRAGTKFEYKVWKDVSVGAGYLFRNRDDRDPSVNENRFVAGVTYPILRGAIEVEGSSLYERFVVPSADFNRYKQQFEIVQRDKTFSPWHYQQFLFKQGSGFVRWRSRFGFQWSRPTYEFKAAYQFESLSTGTAWAPRHAIYTELSIDRPLWFDE